MLWWSGAQGRAGVCCAIVGAGAIAGLIAGWSMDTAADASPSDIVASRFPADWASAEPAAAPAADPAASLLNPIPLHAFASVAGGPAAPAAALAYVAPGTGPAAPLARPLEQRPAPRPAAGSLAGSPVNPLPVFALASADSSFTLPAEALGYADPASESAAPAAAPAPKPAAPKARLAPSNKVLNDAQIASIKARLKLTRSQEQYWPAVEAALRGVAYKINSAAAKGSHRTLASIDPNSREVEQLKAAAMPLIMTFSQEQKEEVRQLAHLIGLQRLASMI